MLVSEANFSSSVQLEVLNTLIANDVNGRYHWVTLLEWFDYRRHVCIVFEKLGTSLYDFLIMNYYSSFHIDLVSLNPSPSCLTIESIGAKFRL